PPSLADFAKFPGMVAFGVVGGMAFLTPGGVGPKEFIQGLFLVPIVGRNWATLAVVLQRLGQIALEGLVWRIRGARARIKDGTAARAGNGPAKQAEAPVPDSH